MAERVRPASGRVAPSRKACQWQAVRADVAADYRVSAEIDLIHRGVKKRFSVVPALTATWKHFGNEFCL
jgi:hypothetical protein